MEAVNGDELEGREGINPFCFWTGADFKLRAKKVAGYPNYDSSEFLPVGTLEDLDDAQLESIWKRQHSLQGLVAADQFKTYEELQERLNRVLKLGTASMATPAPAPARRLLPLTWVLSPPSLRLRRLSVKPPSRNPLRSLCLR